MGETDHHHHPPPPQVVAPPPAAPPNLTLSRGPTWTPSEQLHQLQYCIHSNPSWRQFLFLKRLHSRAHAIVERFALLFCIGIIWAFAAILTVSGAYNNWGSPVFRASHVYSMIGAALVSSAESTGTFFAAARLSGATAPPTYVLSRSIGLQGIGMLLEGLFGSLVGTTASVENVGLLGLARTGSRRVVKISTAFMIFFSIFGKFGALFASIPLPIFAAIYCILLGIVAAPGITFIQFAKNAGWVSLCSAIPSFWSICFICSVCHPVLIHVQFINILNTIFSSPATVAIIVGTVLDNTLEA
ncbi:Nucleobase-ascorbate transporter 3 [Hibiscus syriacus]|uniref:Nucleobase-ascorbate transporter 3 n=1 Tax=Hibiscus syriacus TaxID=106335 RepID=A0A6A2YS01_HIBSY|nr:Nucleobase-ascorbate transporter 3 [Hibiscus syriacus]